MLFYGEIKSACHISQHDSCHKRWTSLKKANIEHQTLRTIKKRIVGAIFRPDRRRDMLSKFIETQGHPTCIREITTKMSPRLMTANNMHKAASCCLLNKNEAHAYSKENRSNPSTLEPSSKATRTIKCAWYDLASCLASMSRIRVHS